MEQRLSELNAILHSGDGRTVADALLQTTPSIAVIVDSDGRILRVSRHACRLSGLSAEQMEGLSVEAFFALVEPRAPDGRPLEFEQFPLNRALKGRAQFGREGFFRDRLGRRIPIVSNVAPFRGPSGAVIGAISSVTDLRAFRSLEAELRAALVEKEMLYRELAHRVKNHLQIVAGLVALEARHGSPEVQDFAEEIGGRLQMLAAIYDAMNQVRAGGRIAASPFIEQVVQPYRNGAIKVTVTTSDGAGLEPDHAGPIGMLINEAACNSYKHAFPGGVGEIAVSLQEAGPRLVHLKIADNGVGFGEPGAASASQGVPLMRLLARQLGGELAISASAGGGAEIFARLPIALRDERLSDGRSAVERRRRRRPGRSGGRTSPGRDHGGVSDRSHARS